MIPGSKLITIVRSIPSLYESSFGYFLNECREYKAAKTIDSFYSDPKKWYNKSRRNANSQFAHNHLAFDLGYSTEATEDAEIERIANEIVSAYDLILIRFVTALYYCDTNVPTLRKLSPVPAGELVAFISIIIITSVTIFLNQ